MESRKGKRYSVPKDRVLSGREREVLARLQADDATIRPTATGVHLPSVASDGSTESDVRKPRRKSSKRRERSLLDIANLFEATSPLFQRIERRVSDPTDAHDDALLYSPDEEWRISDLELKPSEASDGYVNNSSLPAIQAGSRPSLVNQPLRGPPLQNSVGRRASADMEAVRRKNMQKTDGARLLNRPQESQPRLVKKRISLEEPKFTLPSISTTGFSTNQGENNRAPRPPTARAAYRVVPSTEKGTHRPAPPNGHSINTDVPRPPNRPKSKGQGSRRKHIKGSRH